MRRYLVALALAAAAACGGGDGADEGELRAPLDEREGVCTVPCSEIDASCSPDLEWRSLEGAPETACARLAESGHGRAWCATCLMDLGGENPPPCTVASTNDRACLDEVR